MVTHVETHTELLPAAPRVLAGPCERRVGGMPVSPDVGRAWNLHSLADAAEPSDGLAFHP
jgi:hypothetical protein